MSNSKSYKKNPIINFRDLGWAELLVALLPILGAYYLGPVPFTFWILLFLTIASFFKKKGIDVQLLRPLIVFVIYYFVHETILLFVADNYNFNKRIENIVMFISVLLVIPILDMRKFKSSLNLVSVICIIGLIYQYIIVFTGGTIHPLEIPGLHMPLNRLLLESDRPSSFFMEPAAYSFYMYVSIAISLIDRRYIWSSILMLSVFLTSSTTGLFAVFIILGVYLFSQGVFRWSSLIVFILGGLMLLALTYTDFFTVGIDKLESTNFETNVRIWQGPRIVGTMNFEEMIFGVPYDNIMDYVRDGRVSVSLLYGDGTDVFMSTIWQIIFSFGILGLLLYLNVFYKIAKSSRYTRPLVICFFVVMFTGSMYIGILFAYAIISLYLMKKSYLGYENVELIKK